TIIAVTGFAMFETLQAARDGERLIALRLPRTTEKSTATVVMLPGKTDRRKDLVGVYRQVRDQQLDGLTKPRRARWTKPITAQFEPGKDAGGPFVVDTFPLPYENPWNALFFVTGVDFLPDGRVAICTAHGDVWTAKESGGTITWKRFATGLYQPLG